MLSALLIGLATLGQVRGQVIAPDPGPSSSSASAAPAPAELLRRDPLGSLAEAAGYGDGERWWDHLVERRRGAAREMFDAILEAMTALRKQAEADAGDTHNGGAAARAADPVEPLREAWMRRTIRRAQMDGAMILAREEARHLLHRDSGIARLGILELLQRGDEPRAAARAFGVALRLAAVAAAVAHHHRGPRVDARQHQAVAACGGAGTPAATSAR